MTRLPARRQSLHLEHHRPRWDTGLCLVLPDRSNEQGLRPAVSAHAYAAADGPQGDALRPRRPLLHPQPHDRRNPERRRVPGCHLTAGATPRPAFRLARRRCWRAPYAGVGPVRGQTTGDSARSGIPGHGASRVLRPEHQGRVPQFGEGCVGGATLTAWRMRPGGAANGLSALARR